MSENELGLIERTADKTKFLPPKPNGLIVDYHRINPKNKVCMWPECGEPTINSHVLSKASIRKYSNNQIIQLQTITYDPFHIIKPKDQREYYKQCDLNKVSTFNGFCETHDHSIFYELDNFNGIMTPKIALLNHYRIICYGLNVIQLQLKRHEFLKKAVLIGAATKKTQEISRKIKNGFFERGLLMAETDYLDRKRICESMITSDLSNINYIYFHGNSNNPLFFGRSGIFFHQFNRKQLPKRFMAQMPYITYASISDGRTCNLIFTYLPQDASDYGKDLEPFFNHPDFNKRLEILIYSQSDCCILRKNIPETSNRTVKEIVDFYL